MGFLFGGGSSKKAPPPTPAPPPPTRQGNPVLDAVSFAQYKKIRGQTGKSYASAAMGGGAPNPTKSYTAGLFSSAGGGV
jgi:hypothetical protein